MESKEKLNYSSCRVREQKSKLSYRHVELGAVKAKKNKNKKQLGMFRPAHTSLSILFLGKRKRKTHSSFFLFTATSRQAFNLDS